MAGERVDIVCIAYFQGLSQGGTWTTIKQETKQVTRITTPGSESANVYWDLTFNAGELDINAYTQYRVMFRKQAYGTTGGVVLNCSARIYGMAIS